MLSTGLCPVIFCFGWFLSSSSSLLFDRFGCIKFGGFDHFNSGVSFRSLVVIKSFVFFSLSKIYVSSYIQISWIYMTIALTDQCNLIDAIAIKKKRYNFFCIHLTYEWINIYDGERFTRFKDNTTFSWLSSFSHVNRFYNLHCYAYGET